MADSRQASAAAQRLVVSLSGTRALLERLGPEGRARTYTDEVVADLAEALAAADRTALAEIEESVERMRAMAERGDGWLI
jgi:hypothetical protein